MMASIGANQIIQSLKAGFGRQKKAILVFRLAILLRRVQVCLILSMCRTCLVRQFRLWPIASCA
jgi:hypothetical protein